MNDDAWMEEMLEQQAKHLSDDGFTDGVLRALPPPRRRLRTPILLCSGLLAALVGFFLLPGGDLLLGAVEAVVAYRPRGGEAPVVSFVLIAMVIWGAVAAARAEG